MQSAQSEREELASVSYHEENVPVVASDESETGSEVARLRARLEVELEAMQRGLSGFSAVATHAAINARCDNLGQIHEEMTAVVGEEMAIHILVNCYVKAIGL